MWKTADGKGRAYLSAPWVETLMGNAQRCMDIAKID